jgi:hypothetical protein
MAAMTAVSLLQTGIVSHLPAPLLENFDSDKVNSSDTAYKLGVPDGAVSLASPSVPISLSPRTAAHAGVIKVARRQRA